MLFLLIIWNALTPIFIIVAFIEYWGWTNFIWMLASNEKIVMGFIGFQLSLFKRIVVGWIRVQLSFQEDFNSQNSF